MSTILAINFTGYVLV